MEETSFLGRFHLREDVGDREGAKNRIVGLFFLIASSNSDDKEEDAGHLAVALKVCAIYRIGLKS